MNDRPPDLDALVAPLRSDVLSGATVIAGRAASTIRRVTAPGIDASGDELRELAEALVLRILDAQPAMAPLVALGRTTLVAADGAGDDPDAVRSAIRTAIDDFEARLEASGREVATRAASLLDGARRVLTLSASSTVQRALEEGCAGGGCRVVCLEGRPVLEGRRLASRLAAAGIRTTLAVDAAAGALLPGCDLAVVGADSIGDRGVANKVGTRLVALAAREHDVPVYVLADGTKLLPPGFPQPTDDERPPDEVWDEPGRVRIWNRYFETTPLSRFAGVVLEDGVLDPGDVDRRRMEPEIPDALRAWADRRRGG